MKVKKITDTQLVSEFKKGSMEAFEEIVSRYEAKAFNLAMRFCRNPEDAEEVLQDVFTTVYKKIDSFQGKSAFSSWVYRIIVNAAFMKLRKRKQHSTVSLEDLTPTAKQHCIEKDNLQSTRSDAIVLNHELREILQSSINRLPEQYRAVFILRDVDGMSNQEVSEVLKISIPAVKSRLHRSRMMLRRKLQRYYGDFVEKRNDGELESTSLAYYY